MTNKLSTHMIFTAVYLVLAVLTLLPMATASKPCHMGYEALCSFTPISTIILLGLGSLHIFLQYRNTVVKQ